MLSCIFDLFIRTLTCYQPTDISNSRVKGNDAMDGSPTARLEWDDYKELAPDANAALLSLSHVAASHGLDKGLLELVKLRVSQINACSFCTAWHVNAASRLGVATDKLHTIAAWRGAQGFDVRERAALAWAEALTLVADGVPDDVYAAARSIFSDRELALLTSAVMSANAWNRLGVAYRFTPPAIVNSAAMS
jgi:AhpD family alkylhydroperoxidase